MRRLIVMLAACVASTALAAALTAWLTTQAYWGHGLASPSADETAALVVAVDRYSDYAWDGTATSGAPALAEAAGWENGDLGESPWGRLPAALQRRGLRPAKDDPIPPATLDAIRELLAAEGYSVRKVRAHLVEGKGADGQPMVLAAVFGPELSNDHYPYYEVAAAVEPDGRPRALRVTHYRFDVAGLEGSAPFLAAVPVAAMFLFGWGCAFLGQLAGAFNRRPHDR